MNQSVDDLLTAAELGAVPAPTEKRRCKAKAKGSGNQCRRYAIPGGSVCRNHGGGAPQVKAAAARRLAAEQLQADSTAALAWLGEQSVTDPLDELGRLATESRSLTTALGQRVNALRELEHFDLKNSPHIKAEIELYERAMDRTHRMFDSLIKAGYMERQMKIAEDEALILSGIIRRVLQQVGVKPAGVRKATELLQQEFAALEASPPTIGVM